MSNSDNRPKPKPPIKRLSVRQVEAPKEEKKAPKTPSPYSNEALFTKLRNQAQPNAPKNPRSNPPAPQDEVDKLLDRLIKSYETDDRNSK